MSLFGNYRGLSSDVLHQTIVGALLHDLGKILTPDEILHKPGRLTPEEFEVMKLHARHSRDILATTEGIGELTVITALIALPVNIAFGICAAWAVTRFRFPGRRVLITIIELPFSISPIVAGLCYLLVYGSTGLVGSYADQYGIQLMFNLTGIVLVSLFVTCPFVAREVIPLMEVAGRDQEEAALTLGANGWQTFFHVTLPNIRWALLYGAILANARVIGEFGAVMSRKSVMVLRASSRASRVAGKTLLSRLETS